MKGGNAEQMKEHLRQATPNLRGNELGKAVEQQQAAAGNLQKLIDALEEKPEEDGERLAKKSKDAGKKLDELIDEQERLQKKVEAARKIGDPEQRKEELQKLAREQERLERETRDLAERLNRARAEEPAQQQRRAARQMDEARQQLEDGQPPTAAQDEALDRLDDAADELDRGRERQDEELLREKLAQIADLVKALRERQQRAVEEADRIHRASKDARAWSRPLLSSLVGLRDQQKGLATETVGLAEKRFADLRVFGRMLQHASAAMTDAARLIDERREEALDQLDARGPFEADIEQAAQAGILNKQTLALKRLEQLLDAIKPDAEMMQAAKRQQAPMQGNPPNGGGGGDNIPPLAQLKALRALQAELLLDTESFAKRHPDRAKIDEAAVNELLSLEKAQREIAELVRDLSAAAGGDEP